MVIANLYAAKKAIALPVRSVGNNSLITRTHISQNSRVNKAKTILRRKGTLGHSSNHNYYCGGNLGLGLEEN